MFVQDSSKKYSSRALQVLNRLGSVPAPAFYISKHNREKYRQSRCPMCNFRSSSLYETV